MEGHSKIIIIDTIKHVSVEMKLTLDLNLNPFNKITATASLWRRPPAKLQSSEIEFKN